MRGYLAGGVWGAVEEGLLGEWKMEGKKGKNQRRKWRGVSCCWGINGERWEKMKGSWGYSGREWSAGKKWRNGKNPGADCESCSQKNEEEKIRGWIRTAPVTWGQGEEKLKKLRKRGMGGPTLFSFEMGKMLKKIQKARAHEWGRPKRKRNEKKNNKKWNKGNKGMAWTWGDGGR